MSGIRDRHTRSGPVRRKSLRYSLALPILIPGVFLAGIGGYAVSGYVDKGLELQADADLTSSTAKPVYELLTRLQEERRLTAIWQADATGSSRTALDNARGGTDTALEAFRSSAALSSDDPSVRRRAERLSKALDQLAEQREAVDKRSTEQLRTYRYYTETILRGTALVTAASGSSDGELAHRADAMASLLQLSELVAREDTQLSAALTRGSITRAVRQDFGDSVAAQREVRAAFDPERLPRAQAEAFDRLVDGEAWGSLVSIENAVASGATGLAQRAEEWRKAADEVSRELRRLHGELLDSLADDASAHADDHFLEAVVAAVLALAALAAAMVLALREWRSLTGRLTKLRESTVELAESRIPQTMEKLARGERVEVSEPKRQPDADADELGRLDAAIQQLAHTAESTAVQQARGFEGTEKVFANLTRRTQGLIHRLISLLDDLERKHEDSDLLKDIFKVDHLATRVRRHSENLVILGGSLPTRRWSAPVSIIDVLRSAVSETEEYTRVKVQSPPRSARVSLVGRAVADVTHLLAELIENGTSFSPPDTQVSVSAKKVAKGLAIHVEDHGLGMPESEYERLNNLLADPPEPDMMTLGQDPRLGMFVVARLAQRHGLKVSLRESHYGGTLAIVLVPSALLEERESPLSQLPGLPLGTEEEDEEAAATTAPATSGTDASTASATTSGSAASGEAEVQHDPVPSRTPAEEGLPTRTRKRTELEPVSPDLFPDVGSKTLPYHPLDESGYPTYGGAGLLPPVEETAAGQGQQPAGSATPPVAATSSSPSSPSTVSSPPSSTPAAEPGRDRGAESASQSDGDPFPQLKTPRVLPRRVRGESLVRQLRDTPPPRQDEFRDDHTSSPDRLAATMAAIQRGTGRARGTGAPRPANGQDPQAETPGHGTDQL